MFNAEEYPGRDNKLSFWHLKNVGANGSWERPSTDTSIAQYLDPNEDYRTDWHTIGVEWGETYVRYFFDGHLIGEYAAKIPYRMVPIISFNYRPYNNDGTLKTSTDGAKADMERDFEIDYYRVWKNKNVADPYQAPELPENGNIASYAYISQFGLTSAQYNATPPEMFQDGDYTKMVWSGLQTKNADDSDYQEEHTKLPSYTFVDFLGPVDYNTVVLYSVHGKSQAPTLVDIEINRTTGRIDDDSVWETAVSDVRLDWHSDSSLPEGIAIRLPETVTGNNHMRIVTKEANFNHSGRFGLSEIEIGTDLEPAQFSLPEYVEPEIPSQQQLPAPVAHWTFEGDTPFTDIINGNVISQYTDAGVTKQMPEATAENTLAGGTIGASYNGSTTAGLMNAPASFKMNQDFTISMWIKMDKTPSVLGHNSILLHLPTGKGNHMLLSVNQEDTIQTYYGAQEIEGSSKLAADTWYHVMLSKNGTQICVYLNGELEFSGSSGTNYNSGSLVLGNSRVGSESNALSGQLDEVLLYQSPFTPEQAAWYYYSTETGEKNRITSVSSLEDVSPSAHPITAAPQPV